MVVCLKILKGINEEAALFFYKKETGFTQSI